MTNKLKQLAGLIDFGVDEDGNIEWTGTKQQWDKYEELSNKADNGELSESEVDDMLVELPIDNLTSVKN